MKDVIIALDFPTGAKALSFLAGFGDKKPYVKVGMELFYQEGPDIVRRIKDLGHPIFLDLKLHDIPNTVKSAMARLAGLSVDMVNVHAAGTRAMMAAAREGLGDSGVKLIAVTQLTSTGPDALRDELLIPVPLMDTVLAYGANAKAAGLDGVVCSPLEAAQMKAALGADFLTVTPGIRYPSGHMDDQVRVTSPAKARAIGTDYIVVGRPITAAADPLAAYAQVAKDFLG